MFFDKYGFLTPYTCINTDLDTIYEQFVSKLPTSHSRATLYYEWIKYSRLLRQEVGVDFEQWVNGSFVSRKLNPKDIDIVSFMPYQIYEQHEAVLDKFWSDTWEAEGIDAYIVKLYPDDHHGQLTRTVGEREQWLKRYATTKPDRNFVSYPKGFLSITVA